MRNRPRAHWVQCGGRKGSVKSFYYREISSRMLAGLCNQSVLFQLHEKLEWNSYTGLAKYAWTQEGADSSQRLGLELR